MTVGRDLRLPADVVADLAGWYLATSAVERWDPFASIPWPQLDPGRLTEAQASAVRFVTYIEDHLPGYFAVHQQQFPVNDTVDADEFTHNRELYRFFVKWAQEEDRHAYLLTTYQVRAGLASADDLRRRLAEEGRKRFDVPYRESVQIFTYTLIQEKATQLFYQQLAARVSEPVLRSLLTHLARDEARHFAFFSRLMEEYVRRFGAALLPSMKDVLRSFKMPLAETLKNYWRWALAVSETAGGYDHTEAYEALVRVVRQGADGATWARSLDLIDLVRSLRR